MQNAMRIDDPFFVLLTPEAEWIEEERDEVRARVAEADKAEKIREEKRVINTARPVCPRCSGRGVMSEYTHIMNGKCFRCGGSGYAD